MPDDLHGVREGGRVPMLATLLSTPFVAALRLRMLAGNRHQRSLLLNTCQLSISALHQPSLGFENLDQDPHVADRYGKKAARVLCRDDCCCKSV